MRRIVMLKAVYSLVALLAFVWLASTIVGAFSGSGIDAVHLESHAPSLVSDGDGDGDDADLGMLAPPAATDDDDRDGTDPDADGADALSPSAGASRIASPGEGDSRSMTRWGLRPSGEHRASADRPPRV